MNPRISVRQTDPHSEAATKLVRELSEVIATLYADMGDDGSGSFGPNDVLVPRSAFVVAYLDGEPVGCGALRPLDADTVEVKRMFVAAPARKHGVGREILAELERLAGEFGYRIIRLETGDRLLEAIAFYERCGFDRIPPFGKYVGNPISVCFEKKVTGKNERTTMTQSLDTGLSPKLVEDVLTKLGLDHRPEPTRDGLGALYAAWSFGVPFDNVRKLIHVRSGNAGPLPGNTPEDFFAAWLKHGTGGTCWSGAGALQALLLALGFKAVRGIATMLAAPDIPPNHGTVRVTLGDIQYLVDSAMMCVEPLQLKPDSETVIEHPAWGLRCSQKTGHWYIQWRPLHKLDGFECRLESFGADAGEFQTKYESTRGWSPFNYEVTARMNRGDCVVGTSFGHAITLQDDGDVSRKPIAQAERMRLLIEDIGMSEEIVGQLPDDVPTPPPPWSRTARAS